jgi:hypothetical protein
LITLLSVAAVEEEAIRVAAARAVIELPMDLESQSARLTRLRLAQVVQVELHLVERAG